MLTVIGLYGFLWGKKKEMERIKKETEEKVFNTKKNQLTKIDLDLQLSENSKHSFTNAQSKI